MLEPHVVSYTHAYFPVGLFDEVNLDYMDHGFVFGRKGDTYIMLRAMSDSTATLSFKNDMPGVSPEDIVKDMSKIKDNVREMIEMSGDTRYDLILDGGSTHAWVTELGSIEESGSFLEFINAMMSNKCDFSDMTVSYETDGKLFNVKYNEHFKINGEKIDTNYARYENDYVDGKIERGAEIMHFSFGGYALTLNFETATREEE